MAEDQTPHAEVTEQQAAHQVSPPAEVKPQPEGGKPSRLRTFGAAVAALLLYALLADAAVETFLSGSPLRWIVGGAVAAYLILTVLLWKRFRWETKAAFSLLVLLGLLAVTAWLPEGLTRGVTFARVSTATILAAISALAILASAIVLARLKFVALPAKIAIILLAVYGIAAFVIGIAAAVPYAKLFHGRSLLDRLPFWLQGAFISTLIVIPAAILLQLVTGALRIRGTHLRRWAVQVVGLSLSLVMALAGFAAPVGSVRGRASVAPAPQTSLTMPAPAPSRGTAQQPEVQPPSAKDSQAAEPVPLVQGSTSVTEEYRISIAKVRAAIDFSRLDPRLLQAKLGTDPETITRFVQNEIRLDMYPGALRGATGALLARAGNAVDRALLLATLLQAAGHRVRFAQGTLSPRQAEELVREGFRLRPVSAGAEPFRDEIVARAGAHFLLLGDTLYAAGFRAPAGDAEGWQRAIQAAQEHVWVQLDSQGQWVNVDPSPGVEFGRSLVQAQRISDALDARFFYTVRFAIEVEVTKEGKPARQIILEFRAPSAELAGIPLGLFHEIEGDKATVFLLAGDLLYKGSSFDVGSAFQSPGGPLSSFPGLGGEQERRGSVTGEWLHISVTAPGVKREATYTILDTLGPSGRQGGSPQPEGPTTASDAFDAVVGIGVLTGGIPVILPFAVLSGVTDPSSKVGLARMLAMATFNYLVIREEMPSSPWESPPRFYIDFPNVVIARAQVMKGTTAGLSLDLALKAYRLLRAPQDRMGANASFYYYLYNGVLDHTVERAILGEQGAATSVGMLIETAVDQDIAIQAFTSENTNLGGDLTPNGRSRVLATLQSRRIVILPVGRPKGWPEGNMGWWSVAPDVGWTEDTMESGGHPAATERGVQEKKQTRSNIRAVACLAVKVLPTALFVAAAISGNAEAMELIHTVERTDLLEITEKEVCEETVAPARHGGVPKPLPKPQRPALPKPQRPALPKPPMKMDNPVPNSPTPSRRWIPGR